MRLCNSILLLLPLIHGIGFAQNPVIPSGGIVNGATFNATEAIAPGSLISIFGSGLATSTASADTIPLSASLGGSTVTFTGATGTFSAPLLYVQPSDAANSVNAQINAQVPWEVIPPGVSSATVNVVVTSDGLSSQPTPVKVSLTSPGIFASNTRAIAVNYPDNTLAWPVGVQTGLTTHPAKAGDTLIVYTTGLGAVDSPIQDGHNSIDKLRNTVEVPVILIGGVNAQVTFSGLTPLFVGVYQVNVIVPSGVTPGDTVSLQIQMDGVTTPAGSSTIAITQ